jgi:hypothetical protein
MRTSRIRRVVYVVEYQMRKRGMRILAVVMRLT